MAPSKEAGRRGGNVGVRCEDVSTRGCKKYKVRDPTAPAPATGKRGSGPSTAISQEQEGSNGGGGPSTEISKEQEESNRGVGPSTEISEEQDKSNRGGGSASKPDPVVSSPSSSNSAAALPTKEEKKKAKRKKKGQKRGGDGSASKPSPFHFSEEQQKQEQQKQGGDGSGSGSKTSPVHFSAGLSQEQQKQGGDGSASKSPLQGVLPAIGGASNSGSASSSASGSSTGLTKKQHRRVQGRAQRVQGDVLLDSSKSTQVSSPGGLPKDGDGLSTSGSTFADIVRNAAMKDMSDEAKAKFLADLTSNSDLSQLFLEFLNEYVEGAETYPYYKAKVCFMSKRSCPKLEVDFQQLLKDAKYRELAIRIGNDQDSGHFWLQGVGREFIANEYDGNQNEEENFMKKARIDFANKPDRMSLLKDLLKESINLARNVSVCSGYTVRAATCHGRNLFLCVLLYLLDCHRRGFSWGGRFTAENIMIVVFSKRMQCHILIDKNQSKATRSDKVADLKMLDSIMMPSYTGENGEMPVYFVELSRDLREVTLDEVNDAGFLEYMENHVALVSCMARRNLTGEVHHVLRAFANNEDFKKQFGQLLSEQPYIRDWTSVKWSDDPILYGVYWHEEKDIHKNTLEGAFAYKRHLLHHADNHAVIEDLDETELFAAVSMPHILPYLIKNVMHICKMGGVFATVWSNYRACRADMKDLPK